MAEAWTRHLKGNCIEPFSAGLAPAGLHPMVRQVMGEVGVEMGGQRSKGVWEFRGVELDYVVSLSAKVREWLGELGRVGRYVHRRFEDPLVLAAGARSQQQALEHYRRIREEIRAFVEQLPAIAEQLPPFHPTGPIR